MADAELWKKRVAEWRASGLGAAEYCKGQEFTAGTLYRWSSRLADQARGELSAQVPLVRLVRGPGQEAPPLARVAPRATEVIIEVHGARVLVPAGADAATVRVALEALEAARRGAERCPSKSGSSRRPVQISALPRERQHHKPQCHEHSRWPGTGPRSHMAVAGF
ncbi:IS66 family insertion sequence element accessory protein TnpA [Pyxidicoccus sp. 3LG]